LKVAGYTLHAVENGEFALDGGAMFGVVPRPLWERTNPADPKNRIDMRLRSLLLRSADRTVLIDAGMGAKWSGKQRDIYRLDLSRSSTSGSLGALGVSFEDVTDVILTHLHFDHAGGSTVRLEDGTLAPAFPRATYWIQAEHLEWAKAPSERDGASFAPDDFLPLLDAGRLRTVEGEAEILPGVRVLVFHGHTPAMQLPLIRDEENTVFYCADLIPMHSHLRLPYIMGYDLRPLVTLREKKQILARASKEGWLLFLEHEPWRWLFTVKQEGGRFLAAKEIPLAD